MDDYTWQRRLRARRTQERRRLSLVFLLLAACIGALLHIAEDAFCGKVPLFLPWQKVGIKLFTVGSVTEYLFSMAVVILTYIIHAQVMVK